MVHMFQPGLVSIVHSWGFIRHPAPAFSKVGKIYFLFEIQIIAGFDNFSGIQFTSKQKIRYIYIYMGSEGGGCGCLIQH